MRLNLLCSGVQRAPHIKIKHVTLPIHPSPVEVCSWANVTPLVASAAPTHTIICPQSNVALPCLRIFPVCVCVCSPMTETSYSIRNRASWPLCISMVKASACFSLFKGIPSMLNTLSPAFNVPSLKETQKEGKN